MPSYNLHEDRSYIYLIVKHLEQGSANFSVKGQLVCVLDFADHPVITTPHPCCCCSTKEHINKQVCLCFNHPLFMGDAVLIAYNFHVIRKHNFSFDFFFFPPQPFKNGCLFPRAALTNHHDWLSHQNSKYYSLRFWSLQI